MKTDTAPTKPPVLGIFSQLAPLSPKVAQANYDWRGDPVDVRPARRQPTKRKGNRNGQAK